MPMQFQADLLGVAVVRPGSRRPPRWAPPIWPACNAGVYPEPAKFADNWRLEHRFKPAMSEATRERKLAGWARAVKGVLASDEGDE